MRRPDYSDIPEVFRRAMEGEGWQADEQGNGGSPPGGSTPPPPSRQPLWADRRIWVVALILTLILSFDWIITTYTDWLWFVDRGYQSVWFRQWIIQLVTFLVAFVIASAVLLGTWHMSRRAAAKETVPLYQGPNLLEIPAISWVINGLGLFFAFTFATAARTQWESILRFIFGTEFNISDPIFNQDVGFYIFSLPVLNFVQGWFMPLLVFTFLGVLALYALRFLPTLQTGQITLNDIPASLRRITAVMGGVFFALWAVGYQLATYDLLFSDRGVVFGAGYTDVNATLIALYVQIAIAGVMSIIFFYNYVRLQVQPIFITGVIWIGATVLLSGVFPAVQQRFVVEPSELDRERPYIENNIEFTRLAFGLDGVEVRDFGDVDELQEEDLQENETALQNIRLWDYRPLQDTIEQLQTLRPYYQFSSVDIDRYTIDGEVRQVMLAARELDKNSLPNNNWVNRKIEFTHGYGLAMNPVDSFTSQGRPEFFISNLPPQSTVDIEVEQPEIYFGEVMNDHVFVGSDCLEFSYPDDEENIRTSYDGTGGVALGGALRQLAFAIRFGESNLLFSDCITPETRTLYYRQIQERVSTITPFLVLDSDPYLVVVDGRLMWFQDAYTTSSSFPYSDPIGYQGRAVNYIRNSVKITIDAYNGDVNYYIVDEEDPIIRAYSQAFPDLFQPIDEMPEPLQAHIRYPEDLFRIQTIQYLVYHVTDAQTFFNGEDERAIPNEQFEGSQVQPMEPYYILFRLPGEEETEYLLIQPFTPKGRQNMTAWIAARNDPENYGQLVAYELSRQQLVVGPSQIEGFIDQEPEISQQITLWNQQGSGLIRGNLIVIPLNDSFLYVEPIYLQSESSAIPELRRVIVASGERIIMRETLDEALAALLNESTPAAILETEGLVPSSTSDSDSDTTNDTAAETPSTEAPAVPATDATIEELIEIANQQFIAAQTAQQNGDWAAYGEQIEALEQTLRQLEAVTANQ